MSDPLRPSRAKVTLSTSSVFPEPVENAFVLAKRLGYDGLELMPLTDGVSSDLDAVRRLSDEHEVPIVSVHAPCLLVTQRVWGLDPWGKLQRAKEAAEILGADTVVVHPPFRWQREYARRFIRGVAKMHDETDVRFAVENMYPWRVRSREWEAYAPDWDPRNEDYEHVTLDLSHTAVSGTDALKMARDLGDQLAHVHMADGTGLPKDEHLVPGRGTQPCAQMLGVLAEQDYRGSIVLEVSTRRTATSEEREHDLAEALAFTRLHLASPK